MDRLLASVAQLFRMDEESWRRHANPWSVWTRIAAFPLLVLAVWSYVWIAWWSLAPIAAMLLFLWLNPRLFPPPRRTDNWASRAVLGERMLLLNTPPVPAHERRFANLLNLLALLGLPLLAMGYITREPWLVCFGASAVWYPKLWFVDRMARLYERAEA